MIYSAILMSGKANGGLHEILTVKESMKEKDNSPAEDGSVQIKENTCVLWISVKYI